MIIHLLYLFLVTISAQIQQDVLNFYNRPLWDQSTAKSAVNNWQSSASIATPTIVKTWDINMDGSLDIVYFSLDSLAIQVCLSNSGVGFSCSAVSVTEAVADFAIGELITGSPQLFILTISGKVLQKSLGSPSSVVSIYSFNCTGVNIYAKDIDGDGLIDIIGACQEGNVGIFYWLNNQGTLATRQSIQFTGTCYSMNVNSLSGTNIMDIVIVTKASNSMQVSVFLQRNNFQSSVVIGSVSASLTSNVTKILISDLNSDGLNDLLVMFPARIFAYYNNYNNPGVFITSDLSGNVPIGGGQVYLNVDCGDWDGNRFADLAIVYGTPGYSWKQQQQQQQQPPPQQQQQQSNPYQSPYTRLILFDICQQPLMPFPQYVGRVLYYNPNYAPQAGAMSPLVAGNSSSTILLIADFNNDGSLDLIERGTDGLYIYFGTENQRLFASPQVIGQWNSNGLNAAKSVTYDLDNNGFIDYIVCYYATNYLFVDIFMNNGTMGFANSNMTVSMTGFQLQSLGNVLVMDVNHDGMVDLVFGTGVGIVFLPGVVDHSFSTSVTILYSCGYNGGIVSSDVNGDGYDDLIFVYSVVPGGQHGPPLPSDVGVGYILNGRGNPWIFKNVTSGLLNSMSVNASWFPSEWKLKIADLNGDSTLDYVVMFSTFTQGTCSVAAIINGNVSVIGMASYGEFYDITLADMNNDGLTDIVIVPLNTQGLKIYSNSINGFQLSTISYNENSAAINAPQIFALDINLDGLVDVLVVGQSVEIFIQIPRIEESLILSFEIQNAFSNNNPVQFYTGQFIDIDGDGDLDFIGLGTVMNTAMAIVMNNIESSIKVVSSFDKSCFKSTSVISWFTPCYNNIYQLPKIPFAYYTRWMLQPGGNFSLPFTVRIQQNNVWRVGTSTAASTHNGMIINMNYTLPATLHCTSVCFSIQNSNVYFSGLNITSGTCAISIVETSVVFINNSTFSQFSSSAIQVVNSQVMVLDSSFLDNSGYGGGAISMIDSQLQTKNCLFKSNIASSNGGAITLSSSKQKWRTSWSSVVLVVESFSSSKSFVNLIDSFFYNNTGYSGGAVSLTGGCIIDKSLSIITNCQFNGNNAQSNGGSINSEYFKIESTLNSYIKNVAVSGGALFSTNSEFISTDDSFSNNNAVHGGAWYSSSDSNIVNFALFNNNTANMKGGAIYCSSSLIGTNITATLLENDPHISIYSSSFKGNSGQLGGALNIGDRCIARYSLLHFENNYASFHGGAIYSNYESLSLCNDSLTFSNNQALYGGGGAIYALPINWDYAFPNVSVSGNIAAYGSNIGSFPFSLYIAINNFTANTGDQMDKIKVYLVDSYSNIVQSDPVIENQNLLGQIGTDNVINGLSLSGPFAVIGLMNGTISFDGIVVTYYPTRSLSLSLSVQPYSFLDRLYANVNITMNPCPIGTYTVQNGCIVCPSGTYGGKLNATQCTSCESSLTCSGGAVDASSDYFLYSLDANSEYISGFTSNATALKIGKCPSGYCLGSNQCLSNHTGFLCSACVPGYQLWKAKCTECSSTSTGTTGIIIQVLILAAYAVYSYFGSTSSISNQGSSDVKEISIFFFQTATMLFRINPSAVEDYTSSTTTGSSSASLLSKLKSSVIYVQLSSMISIFSLNIDSWSNSCPGMFLSLSSSKSTFVEFWFQIAQVPLILGMIILISFAAMACDFMLPKKTENTKNEYTQARRDYLSKIIRSSLACFSFVYMPTLESTINLLCCRSAFTDGSGDLVLSYSPTISCTDPTYKFWQIFSLIIITLMVVVYPICIGYILSRNNVKDPIFIRRYGALVSAFKPQSKYWNIVLEYRKVAMAAATVFYSNSPGSLTLALTSIFSVLSLLQYTFDPYKHRIINFLDYVNLVLLFHISTSILGVPVSLTQGIVEFDVLLYLIVAIAVFLKVSGWIGRELNKEK